MFVAIITDCKDSATFGRQKIRAINLFQAPVVSIGIDDHLDFKGQVEAAGNLIDMLEVSEKQTGVILVNAAPRNHKKWPNGTPFGYFWYGKTLVVSSVDGCTLSLVKKMGLASEINLLDIPQVVDFMQKEHNLDKDLGTRIINTQFRSLEFVPRVAKWVFDGIPVPCSSLPISEIDDIGLEIWMLDNFGNGKTTVLPEDVNFEVGKTYQFANLPAMKAFNRLKDVPIGELALISGSSGLGEKRFLEIVVQGGSAKEKLGLKVGTELKLNSVS